MLNRHQWRCGICGKTFRSERYLDAHPVSYTHLTLPTKA